MGEGVNEEGNKRIGTDMKATKQQYKSWQPTA